MHCERCQGEPPVDATRVFDVPGSSLVHLCEPHTRDWLAGDHGRTGVELVEIELGCTDIGIVPELLDPEARTEAAFLVARRTYERWSAARTAWEDAQAEMGTELSKGSVDALALSSDLNGHDRRSA